MTAEAFTFISFEDGLARIAQARNELGWSEKHVGVLRSRDPAAARLRESLRSVPV
ncbi:hypothetical protein GJ699_31190 [Duganella sp. FT80W]|uniref:Uncharacterized protein n=1 Tax=Duganella guangzhouensis TaxID=2666084 RepID=A0A6I2L885_9BURK|nr:hypothetical protein [Duganella guangzhouensis]MRW94445.1 hypothetical protein [Duganella guangzhouensis]